MGEKPLIWAGSSLDDIRNFPDEPRQLAGRQLNRVQQGSMPLDWRPMPSVGIGVGEIRIHTGREHRVIYAAKFEEGIYVLHAFEKKSRKTSPRDIALARSRWQHVLVSRRGM